MHIGYILNNYKNLKRGISIFYENRTTKYSRLSMTLKQRVLNFFYHQFYFEFFFLRIQGIFYLREKDLRRAREHILTALLKCFAIKDLWVGKKKPHSARNWYYNVGEVGSFPCELHVLNFQGFLVCN